MGGHRLSALEGGGGSPPSNASLVCPSPPRSPSPCSRELQTAHGGGGARGVLILQRLRGLRRALRRALWVIIAERGNLYPFVDRIFEWGVFIATFSSVLSFVPRQAFA